MMILAFWGISYKDDNSDDGMDEDGRPVASILDIFVLDRRFALLHFTLNPAV